MVQAIISGTYFLHLSFLQEASKGMTQDGVSNQLLLLHRIIFPIQGVITNRISCDRALAEMAKSKHSIGFMPGILTLIDEKSHRDVEPDDEKYAFKIASREKISSLQNFFIVSDSEKARILTEARRLGYTLNILSTSDF